MTCIVLCRLNHVASSGNSNCPVTVNRYTNSAGKNKKAKCVSWAKVFDQVGPAERALVNVDVEGAEARLIAGLATELTAHRSRFPGQTRGFKEDVTVLEIHTGHPFDLGLKAADKMVRLMVDYWLYIYDPVLLRDLKEDFAELGGQALLSTCKRM